MTFVSVHGARLFTRVDRGPRPDSPWLVLSNSLAADHTMWDAQVAVLTAHHHVLRYDTRGHGRSDAPSGPYSFDMLVADAASLLDHYEIERAAFMGLSLGGMTGLGVALSHGRRLTRLVCCDARADGSEGFVKSWVDRLADIDRTGMAGLSKGTLERWLSVPFRARRAEETARIEHMILATPLKGYKGCAHALMQLDYLKDLHRITVPTLFVVGSEDQGAPPAVMADMAGRVAGAKFAVIEGGAHLPNIDHAAEFNRVVLSFLEGG